MRDRSEGLRNSAWPPGPLSPNGPARQWCEARGRFLAAVAPQQRAAVRALVGRLPGGSFGLHAWLCALAWEAAFLPAQLPCALVQVYLDDPEAAPLAECQVCRLALPVRPGRRDESGWGEGYFAVCPVCGGRSGWCRPAGRWPPSGWPA
jgi:hypothetical protein